MVENILRMISNNLKFFLSLWVIIIFFNQLLFFDACFRLECILSALPHTGIIATLIMYIIARGFRIEVLEEIKRRLKGSFARLTENECMDLALECVKGSPQYDLLFYEDISKRANHVTIAFLCLLNTLSKKVAHPDLEIWKSKEWMRYEVALKSALLSVATDFNILISSGFNAYGIAKEIDYKLFGANIPILELVFGQLYEAELDLIESLLGLQGARE